MAKITDISMTTFGYATNITDVDSWNGTMNHMPPWRYRLLVSYKVVLTSLLVLIMVAMGCNITLKEIWQHLKHPVALVIGAAGQFIILPLLAFGLSHALSLSDDQALGTIIVATCPGGTVSNIFTYWAKGDVSLSVSMTTMSTLLSFGTMPLNIWLYSRSWAREGTPIPYISIVITLASILGPVILGQIIKRGSEKAATIITKIGSVSGILCIIVAIIMQLILFPAMLTAKWQLLFIITSLPVIGFIISYLIAFICRQKPNICRTIGFETGCQNAAMAIAIIALSFSNEDLAKLSLPSVLYGAIMSIEGFIFCGAFRLVLRLRKDGVSNGTKDNTNEESTQVPLSES